MPAKRQLVADNGADREPPSKTSDVADENPEELPSSDASEVAAGSDSGEGSFLTLPPLSDPPTKDECVAFAKAVLSNLGRMEDETQVLDCEDRIGPLLMKIKKVAPEVVDQVDEACRRRISKLTGG